MQLSLVGMLSAAAIAVPAIAAQNPPRGSAAVDARAAPSASAPVQYYVDLNNASRKELMTLPGVGAAEAKRIIANRPYRTKTDLVDKNVLPMGPFLSLRHLVVAMPAKAPKGRS